MTAPQSTRRKVATRGGVVVAIGTACCLTFLNKWEDGGKTQYVVYADKLAFGLPTACNGITEAVSPYPVVVGEVWSQAKCDEVAALVAEKTQTRLAQCLTGKVTQNAFDALTSHAHNFGVESTCGSMAVKLINAGDLENGCRALSKKEDGSPNWSEVKTGKKLPNGKPEMRFVQGLYNRRLDETTLCLKGDQS